MRTMNIRFKNTEFGFLDKTRFHKKTRHYVLLTQSHNQVPLVNGLIMPIVSKTSLSL